jgi:hypothetical protein
MKDRLLKNKLALKNSYIAKLEKILHNFFSPTPPIKIKLGLQIGRGY